MSSTTSVVSGASSDLASRWFPASARSFDVPDPRGRSDARPSRIGGAPLSGAHAVTAYQRTAALHALAILTSRIDEVA
jgi:hypothetical protein